MNILTLSALLSALTAGALWLVWHRDREQVFARDIALWYAAISVATLCIPFWGHPDSFLFVVGFAGVFGGFAVGHSFLLLGMRRFATDVQPKPFLAYKLFAAFFTVYGLIGWLVEDATQVLGACALVVVASAGVYATSKLWHRGLIERSIGLLIIASALSNLLVAYWGEAAFALALGLVALIRSAIAFLFVFAALNRSGAKAQHNLQRFEQLSENSLQGIMVLDDKRIYYVNPAVVKMFGYASKDEMLAADPLRSVPGDATEDIRARLMRGMHMEQVSRDTESIQLRNDGTEAYMRFAGWKVEWDGHLAMQVLVTDETEKHKVAQEIQHAEAERLRIQEEHRLSLIALNAQLERKVAERTRDLAESNGDLADANLRMKQTLATLRNTQAELVQREKLASLGRMVAGIAHELNTPLGNALTIGSSIRSQVLQLQRDIESGQLKKSMLHDFLTTSAEGTDVLERSLQKAHALITNFRQVAQDYTSEPLGRFDLSELLSSMQFAMQPGFEGTNIALEFALADHVEIESYCGHITQVVTQLIDNARQHAFTDTSGGKIRVVLAVEGDMVSLAVSDNGRGIAVEYRDKVFDPFFTSRMGGRMGLGLNAVFSIVTTRLEGGIQLSETEPCGASFTLRLPRSPAPAA